MIQILCSLCFQPTIKVLVRTAASSESLILCQSYLGGRQNSVACRCVVEISVFLLAFNWDCSPHLWVGPPIPAPDPFLAWWLPARQQESVLAVDYDRVLYKTWSSDHYFHRFCPHSGEGVTQVCRLVGGGLGVIATFGLLQTQSFPWTERNVLPQIRTKKVHGRMESKSLWASQTILNSRKRIPTWDYIKW